jgi:lipopolysaccharide/colanic/teichoic acid biosynthesis glycosyltransferase
VTKSYPGLESRNRSAAKRGAPRPALSADGVIPREAEGNRLASPASHRAAIGTAAIRPAQGWYASCKRGVDLVLALLLLTLMAPLLLLAALLVKLTSRGPVLYSQGRLGRHSRPFTLYKIRTMADQCESLTGIRWSIPGDPRVTPLGRFLRRAHLDELPQLWNVLRGDMSLVGPRPERPEFVSQLEQVIPRYRERLLVRPGLTGLAQLQLPPDTDLTSVAIKLCYDLFYVRRAGGWLDFRLLVGTALMIAGVPFGGLRCVLGLPSREAIVDRYWASLPARFAAVQRFVKV